MPELPDIAPFNKRLNELDQLMAEPDFFSDARKAADLAREHQKLTKLVELVEEFKRIESNIAENEELLRDSDSDEELKEMAQEELPELNEALEKNYQNVIIAMIPPDPTDSRNTIIEVRAGTGGEEAALFAGDLYRMYCRYAEDKGWKVEVLGSNESDVGGFKEISFLITGEEVYKMLKFESGVHRVQRVPATEAGGRVHTSASTVAVLPEAEEVDLEIDPNDLDISVMRASGAGGQHVNKTESAVQIVHLPTGTTVYCADERSQLKNKQKAMKVLYSRVLDQVQRAEQQKYAAERKNQIGTGDRSERIRTYNFPQGRISDHRINLTQHNLTEFMEGDITSVINALHDADLKGKIDDLLNQ